MLKIGSRILKKISKKNYDHKRKNNFIVCIFKRSFPTKIETSASYNLFKFY